MERLKAQGTGHKAKIINENLFSPYALRLMQSAKRRAESEKLSMSKLPLFLRYAPCAMLYAIWTGLEDQVFSVRINKTGFARPDPGIVISMILPH
mgnify:CR=1 FL=1